VQADRHMTGENETILVVDDEPEIADLYAMWLQRDHEVRTAYSGPEALEAVDESVDIVFLDRRMPRMTGDEVLAELRGWGLDCMVVLMTAVDPDFEIIDIDFDEYLTKPVMRDDIEEIIETLRERPTEDETLREYHALASKKKTLEAEKTHSELRRSDAYQQLVDRVEELAEAAGISPSESENEFIFREFSDE
jgi:DNA-binding NtrC family response regulator